jgi:hypothetical protein
VDPGARFRASGTRPTPLVDSHAMEPGVRIVVWEVDCNCVLDSHVEEQNLCFLGQAPHLDRAFCLDTDPVTGFELCAIDC